MTCPECGADLRAVGILPRGVGRGVGVGGRIVLWLIGVAMVGSISNGLLTATVVPHVRTAHGNVGLNSPRSDAYRSVELRYAWDAWSLPIGGGTYRPLHGLVQVSLRLSDGSVVAMEVDPVTGRWAVVEPANGPGGTAFGASAVEQLFLQAGISTADPYVQLEIDEVVGEVTALGVGQMVVVSGSSRGTANHPSRPFGSSSSSSGSAIAPARFATPLLVLVWLLVAAWGVRRIMRRGRLFGAG